MNKNLSHQDALNNLCRHCNVHGEVPNCKCLEKIMLQELINANTPTKPTYKQVGNNLRPYCSKCGLRLRKTWVTCPRCEGLIDWSEDNE